MEPKQRIAVVGSGIAGTSIAWMLRKQYAVTLFERNDYFGGHTHTIVVDENGSTRSRRYRLHRLQRAELPAPDGTVRRPRRSDARHGNVVRGIRRRTPLEYAGSDLDTLFAQRRNLINPGFLGMVWDILRFNRLCKERLQTSEFRRPDDRRPVAARAPGRALPRSLPAADGGRHLVLPAAHHAGLPGIELRPILREPRSSRSERSAAMEDGSRWKSHLPNRMLEDLGQGFDAVIP